MPIFRGFDSGKSSHFQGNGPPWMNEAENPHGNVDMYESFGRVMQNVVPLLSSTVFIQYSMGEGSRTHPCWSARVNASKVTRSERSSCLGFWNGVLRFLLAFGFASCSAMDQLPARVNASKVTSCSAMDQLPARVNASKVTSCSANLGSASHISSVHRFPVPFCLPMDWARLVLVVGIIFIIST